MRRRPRSPSTIIAPAVLWLIWMACGSGPASAQSWSGSVLAETRAFFVEPAFAGQPRLALSLAAQPEYYRAWDDQSLLIVPFVRLDSADSARTHLDVRELLWRRSFATWDLGAGIGKVFWGVAESQHLVDIINQTDLVENIDTEDKLGQPMVNLTLFRSWGNLDVFLLPFFRERTFPGEQGRFRLPLRVATELTRFESSSGKHHADVALRWSRVFGDWDIGLSHFHGTGREPDLIPGVDDGGEPVLIPRYPIIDQTGLDVQATKGRWLWKLEAIHRSGQGDPFGAFTGGFEYTFPNVRGAGLDVGLLAEYLFDGRGDTATNPFEDDIFLATRLELNDVDSTRLLAGVVVDRETGASFLNLEGSRRLGSSWRAGLEARLFTGIPSRDWLYTIRDDDHLQLEIGWYF